MYKVIYALLTLTITSGNLFSNTSNIQKTEISEDHSKIEKECNLIKNQLLNDHPAKLRNRHSTEFKKEKGSFLTSFCHFFTATIAKFALAGFLFGFLGAASMGIITLLVICSTTQSTIWATFFCLTSLFAASTYAVVKI